MAKVQNLKNNEQEQELPDGFLRALASTLVSRAALQDSLGKTYGGNRDLYNALGYKKEPVFEDYLALYDRQDIANRIVEAYPTACWRKKPLVTESTDKETAFEKAWEDLVKAHKIWHYIRRADIISGIGQYGVLFIGFDDVTERGQLREEVESAKGLTYLKPLMENCIQISEWDRESQSERFGLPLIYKLQVAVAGNDAQEFIEVHHSRILHLAESPQYGDVFGTPRLKKIINRLQDLELVAGGSGEMFWRGAFPGYNFSIDKDYAVDTKALAALGDVIDEYIHDLRRDLRTQGVTVESLSQQVASPEGHYEILIKLISGATGIPQRILTGSERGELASSQDEANFNDRTDERRLDYCEPFILRPFIDLLLKVGVLPEPKEEDGYTIEWPDIDVPSEKEAADIAKVKTDTLVAYSNAPGADMIVTPTMFLSKFLGMTEEEITQMGEALGNAEDLDAAYDEKVEEKEAKEEEKMAKRAEQQAAAKIPADVAAKAKKMGKQPAAKQNLKNLGGKGSGNRGHKGRPGKVGGSAPSSGVTLKTSKDLQQRLAEAGGFTYHPSTHSYPATGYSVATYRDFEKIFEAKTAVSVDELVTPKDIKAFYEAHKETFANDPNAHIGGWFDSENHKVYLDVSTILTNKREAIKLGKQYKQEAIYDLKAGREIYLHARDDKMKAAAKKKGGMIRFDFKPGATPEEVAAGINEIVKKYKK